jgi:hypothetical protein
MSVFKFSAGLCDELEQLIRNFWWGDENERRKIHWLAWDKITKPKLRGGIGFGTFPSSTKHFFLNKLGASYNFLIVYA